MYLIHKSKICAEISIKERNKKVTNFKKIVKNVKGIRVNSFIYKCLL